MLSWSSGFDVYVVLHRLHSATAVEFVPEYDVFDPSRWTEVSKMSLSSAANHYCA